MNQKYFKIPEAVQHLALRGYPLTARTLRDYCRRKKLRFSKPGKEYIFTEQQLEDFLAGKFSEISEDNPVQINV